MADMKAKEQRDKDKKRLSDALTAAHDNVKNATKAAGIDKAVANAQAAANAAVEMFNAASKKTIALNHTAEDEDIAEELRDFAMQAQRAALEVKELGDTKKATL